MIFERQLPELAIYRQLEGTLPLVTNFDYCRYVSPNGNSSMPVHRWFRFKESFSADLLKVIVESITPLLGKTIRLLDPFCGVGTSLLASQEMLAAGYNIAARTKVRWPEIDAEELVDLGKQLLKDANRFTPRIPPLSSLTTGRCISRYMSERVLAIRKAIQTNGNSVTHDAMLLGLASAIEPVSRVRKDGRALRIVERSHPNLASLLKEKWAIMAAITSIIVKYINWSCGCWVL